MKRLLTITIFILTVLTINGQDYQSANSIDFQKHKGFYLSFAGGVNFANISTKVVNVYDLTFKGSGVTSDLKIGGAIKENLLLHATITSKSMSGPVVSSGGKSDNTSNNLSLGEAMIGIGLTYYTPTNFLLSGSVGIGNFTLIDLDYNSRVSTDRGFSMQLKLGKEWWISKRWGLGVAVSYSKSKLTNTLGGSIEELIDSNNFGIVFNATLN